MKADLCRLNRPGVFGDSGCCDSSLGECWVLTVVDQFVFRGCEVVAGAVEASVVVPVDPFQGGEFDVVEAFPGSAVVDQFGFEQADLGFGQRVVPRRPLRLIASLRSEL
jgi:hypothetical protein